jgi:pimeloyl-ACP methyl ester carboxylesterase
MRKAIALATLLLFFAIPAAAQTAPKIGIVVMHGKGGSPARLVNTLAEGLESKAYLVANVEMPWSGKRNYDVDVARADQEVSAVLAGLRKKGAVKLFVAGHSQGGVYGLHYASKHPVDGLIIMAPGGNVATAFYQGKIGDSVSRARSLVAAGKGDERGEFEDFEGAKGNWTVRTTAAIYFSWFDPDGAMNQDKSARALPKSLPVLHVAPRADYPALLRSKQELFDMLPAHPLKRLYEPSTDHRGAPAAAVDEIIRWTTEVAAR